MYNELVKKISEASPFQPMGSEEQANIKPSYLTCPKCKRPIEKVRVEYSWASEPADVEGSTIVDYHGIDNTGDMTLFHLDKDVDDWCGQDVSDMVFP